jgi:hypothetical protein
MVTPQVPVVLAAWRRVRKLRNLCKKPSAGDRDIMSSGVD